jgi:hypothetical protein
MSPENEQPQPDESEDILARAAAEGPIAGIPRHEADEPEPEETPIALSPDDEGDEFTRFNIRG